MKFKITEKNIFGEIDFEIDEESISVFQMYVSPKKHGIGTRLVKELESLVLRKNLKSIIVPATPSKEALSFWIKMGYGFIFSEDENIANRVLNSSGLDMGQIVNTDSGIILLSKKIAG